MSIDASNSGLDKKFLYDWLGGNELLFKAINSLDGNPTYNSLMVFLTNLANHHNFPYFIIAFVAYAMLSFVIKLLTNRGGATATFIIWVGIITVFAASYAVDGFIVKLLKDYFSYPRPYAVWGPQDINVLAEMQNADEHHSFPSGHASFITVTIASLWPVLSGIGPLIGVGLVFAVCWSRIAMGMHFPADVIAGAFLGFIIVLIVRFVIYAIFAKLFRWKC